MASTYQGFITVSEFGNRFACCYYSEIRNNPHIFPLLYSDASTRVQIDGIKTDTATTKRGISVLARSLLYNKIDLKNVNTIQSSAESILVMTSGTTTDAAGFKRKFVETFLLALQGIRYFVLNDIFQFIDGQNVFDQHHVPISSGNIYPLHQAPVLSEDNRLNPSSSVPSSSLPVPSAVSGNVLEEEVRTNLSLVNLADDSVENNLSLDNLVDDSVEQQEQRDSAKEVVVENSPRDETATMSQGGANAVGDPPASDFSYFSYQPVDALENLVRVPVKITYASMVRRPNSQFSPSVAAQSSAQQLNAGLSATPASRGREAQERLGVGQRQPKRICVRNLPLGINGAEIFQLFKNFGRIEPSSVDIKPRSETAHACTAYLNFQEVVGAENAIKASPIQFAGRKVYIEEAKQSRKGFDSEGWVWRT